MHAHERIIQEAFNVVPKGVEMVVVMRDKAMMDRIDVMSTCGDNIDGTCEVLHETLDHLIKNRPTE